MLAYLYAVHPGVREIAAAASVSPSVVMHHRGSKQGLSEAVDKRALALVDSFVTEITTPSGGGPSASLAAALSGELESDPLVDDLAVVLLRDQVHDVLGVDPLARSWMERCTALVLDAYTRGVLSIGEILSTETEPLRGPAS